MAAVDPNHVVVPKAPLRGGRVVDLLVAATLLAGVGLVAATLFGRVWRDPPGAFTAAIAFLPYLYGGFGLWTFVLWSVAPDRRTPAVLLALTAIVASALWLPAWRGPSSGQDGVPLRLMTWNVRRLWGPEGSLGRPREVEDAAACVAREIALEKPDVLTLLEVSAQDVSRLSSKLGLTCTHGDYLGEGKAEFAGLATCVVNGQGWKLVRGTPQRFVDREDWYYIFSELRRDDAVVNLLAVHLYPYSFAASQLRRAQDPAPSADSGWWDLLSWVRRRGEAVVRAQGHQSVALIEAVSRFEDPTIVAGDFNSTRDMALHVRLRSLLLDAWEHGGHGFGATVRFLSAIPLRIDYAYASHDFEVQSAKVPEEDCSDHRPVVVDFRLRARRGVDGDPAGVHSEGSR